MAKRAKKRNHALFTSFTVDDGKRYPMILARLSREFITRKKFNSVLSGVSQHYGCGVAKIFGLDGVMDDPAVYDDEFMWPSDKYYHDMYVKGFPRWSQAFDSVDPTFLPQFELWDWDYTEDKLKLIRPRVDKS